MLSKHKMWDGFFGQTHKILCFIWNSGDLPPYKAGFAAFRHGQKQYVRA